jgi:hypothetical protein
VDCRAPRNRVELAESAQYLHYRKAVIDFCARAGRISHNGWWPLVSRQTPAKRVPENSMQQPLSSTGFLVFGNSHFFTILQ